LKAHHPVKLKRLPWLVCACCGLIYLKNEVSRRAASSACPGKEEDEKGNT
jgi:hypothetical protein